MADQGFNNSSVTFPDTSTAIGHLQSVDFSTGGEYIDLTDAIDATHVGTTGINDPECSIEVNSVTATARGTTGALAVTWRDGGSDAIAAAIVTEVSSSGSVDDKITSTLTFKPYSLT